MRSLIVSCNVTVDGFMSKLGKTQVVADASGADAGGPVYLASLDFIVPDSEQEDDLAARFREVADTIVFGRQTFLDMYAYWPTAKGDMADWINQAAKVVLSSDSDFDVSAWDNSTLAAGDGVDQVRRLKESSGAALVAFGGVKTLRSLVAAELVDEYWLKVSPVVVGDGGSMFSDVVGNRSLTLQSARPYSSGMIDAVYKA